MADATEQWRPVPGYDGLYWVSDLGQVKSFHAGRGSGKRGGLLRPGTASGRRMVSLYKDGVATSRLICHLVLEAFVGPRPPGEECRHGPGGGLDDRLVNLRWGTKADNNGPDKVRDGTSNRGERQWQAKLTRQAVIEARHRYAAGERMGALAAEFGINAASLSAAISGATWGWLAGAVPVDPKRHGRQGTAHHAAKLTPQIVLEARRRYAAGEKQRDLAAEYGVTQATLQKAIVGKAWSHI